jgi:Pectate lyase superfamily protein
VTTPFSPVPTNRAVGTGNPPGDMNNTSLELAAMGGTYNVLNTAYAGGADPTGSNDSTAAINDALAIGGPVFLPAGTYLLNGSSALSMAVAGTRLYGAGYGQTTIKIGGSFSAAKAVSIGADYCQVDNLSIQGASSTVTSNPACTGIEISGGWQHCKIRDIYFQYVNGYIIESVGGSSNANYDLMVESIVARTCAAGIHDQGASGSSWHGEHFYTDIQLQEMGVTTTGTANMDAFYIQDCWDIEVANINVGIKGSASGSAVHVKGTCAAIYFTNADLGGGGNVITIADTTNGSPNGVHFVNGGAQDATSGDGMNLTGGATNVNFSGGFTFNGNYNNGANCQGTGTGTTFSNCQFKTNNQSAGTNYDLDIGQSQFVYVKDCFFDTPSGSSAGEITNVVSDTGHKGVFSGCAFDGGQSPSAVFTGSPQLIRDCRGYNPRGSTTPPTFTGSPFTPSASAGDVSIIFTAVNSMTEFDIGGVSIGSVPVAGVPFRIPARQSVTVIYSGTAPAWLWFTE